MPENQPFCPALPLAPPSRIQQANEAGQNSALSRLAHRWRAGRGPSLRTRLMALGLMPLLLALPLLMLVLGVIGGHFAQDLLEGNLRSHLAAAENYLEQQRSQTGIRLAQLARAQRLVQLNDTAAPREEIDRHLRTAAEGAGLDYLVLARSDGHVLGSSSAQPAHPVLPPSAVIRQASIGVASAGFERFERTQLAALLPPLAEPSGTPAETPSASGPRGNAPVLLIHAAAHLPLSVRGADAVLVGGIVLNHNSALIEHLREIIYPVGSLPGNAEGMTALYVGGDSITASRQRLQGQHSSAISAPQQAVAGVLQTDKRWLGEQWLAGTRYLAGFQRITDTGGQTIGMLGVGFPDAPYRRLFWWLLTSVAALFALTMLAISTLVLRAGKELTQRLRHISDTMTLVQSGNRQVRCGPPLREDELGELARHFDELLQTLCDQDARQLAAQAALTEEAQRSRALFEHANDGILLLSPHGRVLEANPKAAAMLGSSVEDLQQQRMQDWDINLTRSDIEQLLEHVGPEGQLFETRHQRRDGSSYDAEVSVSRVQWGDRGLIFLLQRDISQRKAVESELLRYRLSLESQVDERTQALNDRNEQLDTIFSLSPDGFVSFDDQRRVRFANDAFFRLTGLTMPQVTGLAESDLSTLLVGRSRPGRPFPGLARLRRLQADTTGLDRGGPSPAELLEATRRRRDLFELDSPRHRVVEAGLRLSQAAHVSQVLYLRDVTHETEVDRMKSEFLSTAAHELRTPMTSIYGFVQLLTLRRMDESRTRDLLGTIARQSGLMIEIINQLLDLARIESRRGQDFRREPHALADLVRAVLEGYRLPPGREPAQVQSDLQLPDVIGDGQKLQQALLNIIANAYKYSPAGGPVNIALLQRCDDDGRNQIGVAVSDTGIGMTAEQLTHVCERFYRADSSGNIPGTGLGMAIVKEIIDLHSGELHLQSQPGAGSTVTLWLPAAIQGTEPLPQRRLPALAPPQTPSPAAPHPPSPADAALPH